MPDRSQELPPDETWVAFVRRHQGNPCLVDDPLYAFTEDVIDAIKGEMPGFFTKQQEAFERDLARRTGAGFFLRRPLGGPTSLRYQEGLTIGEFLEYGPFPQQEANAVAKRLAPDLKPEWFKDGPTQATIQAIRDWFVTFWEASGREDKDIQVVQRQEQDEGRLRWRRGEAYAGWLICNPQFRQELGALQAKWQAAVVCRGGFAPATTPVGVAEGATPKARRDACAKAWCAFYGRWCLDRMLTWELPAPLDARLNTDARVASEMPEAAGVTLLLPWYLLRGEQFDLQRVVRRIRFDSAPKHLRPWMFKESAPQEDKTGEISYQRLYWLYRCYELVLLRRYGPSCANNIEKLDRAVGTVMGLDEDWVKRLRQRLARELHGR